RASSRSTTRSSAAGGTPTRCGSTRTADGWCRSNARLEDRALASSVAVAAARRPSEGASTALSLGFVTAYLSLIVILPIAALLWASQGNGLHQFWAVVSAPEAVAALKLSLGAA